METKSDDMAGEEKKKDKGQEWEEAVGDVGERERERRARHRRQDELGKNQGISRSRMTSSIFYHWKQIIPGQGKSRFKWWKDSTSCRDLQSPIIKYGELDIFW